MPNSELLRPFKGKFYQSLEADFTTREGFQHASKLNEWTEAPYWNPDPEIDCGSGLHVCDGHPLFSFRFVKRKNPIFFEVAVDPDPPVPSKDNDGKFRVQKIMKIREIIDSEPEFNPKLLADIADNDYDEDVRLAAVNKLNPETHAELLADIAENDDDEDVRLAAKQRCSSAL